MLNTGALVANLIGSEKVEAEINMIKLAGLARAIVVPCGFIAKSRIPPLS
jgi:hypothetical protein